MEAPKLERLLLRPIEAVQMIGVSRAKIYEMIASGHMPSVRLGGGKFIPMDALKKLAASAAGGA